MALSIPVIDLGAFSNGSREGRARTAAELGQALRTLGFAVIGGHGLDPRPGEALRDAALRFFDLPLSEKMRVRRPRNDQNRGYIPFGEETLVRMAGGEGPPDVKEVFAIGPDEFPADDPYFTGPASYPNFAPNLWPALPDDLRPRMRAYWSGMEGLMRKIAAAIATAVDMPEDAFADIIGPAHTSQLRLLHYPPVAGPLQPGQLRAGEHTDVGMMTILRNDPAPGGLQVRGPGGEWIGAPAIADTYILNIGDLLMRWTNDQLLSTPHRVVVPPADAGASARRLSIGFFVGPRYDAVVSCLPSCCSAENPARYPPVTVHEYRTARFAAGAGDNRPFRAA